MCLNRSKCFVYRDTLKERLRAQGQGARIRDKYSGHDPDVEVSYVTLSIIFDLLFFLSWNGE